MTKFNLDTSRLLINATRSVWEGVTDFMGEGHPFEGQENDVGITLTGDTATDEGSGDYEYESLSNNGMNWEEPSIGDLFLTDCGVDGILTGEVLTIGNGTGPIAVGDLLFFSNFSSQSVLEGTTSAILDQQVVSGGLMGSTTTFRIGILLEGFNFTKIEHRTDDNIDMSSSDENYINAIPIGGVVLWGPDTYTYNTTAGFAYPTNTGNYISDALDLGTNFNTQATGTTFTNGLHPHVVGDPGDLFVTIEDILSIDIDTWSIDVSNDIP